MSLNTINRQPFSNLQTLLVLILMTILSLITPQTESYSRGAPATLSTCTTMLPAHSIKRSLFHYEISISNYEPVAGETVTITIGTENGTLFKGFMAMVKMPGNKAFNFGEFKIIEEHTTKTIKCFDRPDSAVTHTSNNKKNQVQVEWIAPNDPDIFDKDLELLVTFVKYYSEYAPGVQLPEKIRVRSPGIDF